MFLIEVDFHDAESEIVILKRPYARIGSSETSHLVLEGTDLEFDILLEKSIGSTFRASVLKDGTLVDTAKDSKSNWIGLHQRTVDIELDSISISVISIDNDISNLFLTNEKLNSNLINKDICYLLNKPFNLNFPALLSLNSPYIGISLEEISSFYIGKSRQCLLRLDHPFIEPRHARVVKDDFGNFNFEPLASTKSVLINGKQIISSGYKLLPSDCIELFPSFKLVYLETESDIQNFQELLIPSRAPVLTNLKNHFLRSDSNKVSPQTLTINVGQSIGIGRDPVHSVWIDESFISRHHANISVYKDYYGITDLSSNGTKVNDEKLSFNIEKKVSSDNPIKISFGPNTDIFLSNLNDEEFLSWRLNNINKQYESLSIQASKKEIKEELENRITNSNEIDVNLISEELKLLDIPKELAENHPIKNLSAELEILDNIKFNQDNELKEDNGLQENLNNENQESPEDAFKEFQKKLAKKVRNMDEVNIIDFDLKESMDNYSYETFSPSDSKSKNVILLISLVIIIVFALVLVLLSYLQF